MQLMIAALKIQVNSSLRVATIRFANYSCSFILSCLVLAELSYLSDNWTTIFDPELITATWDELQATSYPYSSEPSYYMAIANDLSVR